MTKSPAAVWAGGIRLNWARIAGPAGSIPQGRGGNHKARATRRIGLLTITIIGGLIWSLISRDNLLINLDRGDPGDLVLDPTCGSGTTAFVAEQWGRRWITIDTSRVALALARARIMGARYPYCHLADSPEGRLKEAEVTGKPPTSAPTHGDIGQGFVCERAPHVTLGAIAKNTEIDVIYDEHQAQQDPSTVLVAFRGVRRRHQQFCGFDFEHGSKLGNDPEARIERALFELTEIASAHLSFIRKIVLRKLLGMSQASKVSGKHLSHVHARSGAIRSKYAPRYIEQSDVLGLSWPTAAAYGAAQARAPGRYGVQNSSRGILAEALG